MKPVDPKIITTGILLILSLASGFWVTNSGRPLNTVIFTIHKLIALAGIIFSIIIINNLRKGVAIEGAILAAIVCAGVFLLMTFVSGAISSFEKPIPDLVKIMHKAGPVLFTVSVFTAVVLMLRKL